MPTPLVKKCNQIKQLLPADCWAARRNSIHNGEFDDELVLVYDGDATLDWLNLDTPEALLPNTADNQSIFMLLVLGNLTVTQFIYNENTDGATGLVVLGNLLVPTLVVGGQEIYVTGNCQISELFWGDYNHGDLTVKGDVSALVFMDTEGYHVTIDGKQSLTYHLSNYDEAGDWQAIDSASIADIFDAVLYYEDVSDDEESEGELVNVLARGDPVLSHLQTGKSLLRADFIASGYQPAKQNEISYQDLYAWVTVEKIREVLNLPFIKNQYTDYYNVDKNGYWHNNLHFSFRQKSADHNERIHIGKEIPSDTEEFDCNMVHYEIETDAIGRETVSIQFQAHNGWTHNPVVIPSTDTALIQQAYKRFKAMYAVATRKQQQDDEYSNQLARQTELAWSQQMPYESTHVQCNDVTFKVIMLREADAYCSALHWGIPDQSYPVRAFPMPPTEGYYLLAEEDVVCDKFDMAWENHPENLHVAGFIFLKNLTIHTCLVANEIDVSQFFVVLGNLSAVNIGLWGNTHFVDGNLDTQLLYGKYNHGSLFVQGHVTCVAVVSDDFEMYLGGLNTHAIVDDIGRIEKSIAYVGENDETRHAIIAYPATHYWDEVFIDAIYKADDDDGYGGYFLAVCEKMLANVSCLDINKIKAPLLNFRKHAAKDLQRLFKHPHFKTENTWISYPTEGDSQEYYFAYRSDTDTLSLRYRNKHQFYNHMVMLSPKKGLNKLLSKTNDCDLYVDYYEQDNDTKKLEFSMVATEDCLEAYQAMHSFRQALKHFGIN